MSTVSPESLEGAGDVLVIFGITGDLARVMTFRSPDEVLLHAAMVGESSYFARQDALEETWRVVQPLLDAPPPVEEYEQGSWGTGVGRPPRPRPRRLARPLAARMTPLRERPAGPCSRGTTRRSAISTCVTSSPRTRVAVSVWPRRARASTSTTRRTRRPTRREYQGRRRMTLTPTLDRARELLRLVSGDDKVDALRRLRDGDRSIPAGRVSSGHALLVADAAAAGEIS